MPRDKKDPTKWIWIKSSAKDKKGLYKATTREQGEMRRESVIDCRIVRSEYFRENDYR